RADDHDVVEPVAHHLELELVPTANGLLDEHLADRALGQTDLRLATKVGLGSNEAAAVPTERERRSDDRGNGNALELVGRRDDPALRHAQPDRLHRLAEELPVLGASDRFDARADQLDAE